MAAQKNTGNNNARKKTSKSNKNVRARAHDNYEYEPLHTREETIKEFVIWIALIVCVILQLSVLNLCGPLSNYLGYFLFGMLGITAYIFPILLFFTIGLYFINKNNRYVVHRIICFNVLYMIVAAILQMFVNSQVNSIAECYNYCGLNHVGGGLVGGLISIGFSSVIGTIGTAIVLVIASFMLIAFISGRFIASLLYDRSSDMYNDYTKKKTEIRRQQIIESEVKREEKREKKRMMYTFPKEEKVTKAAEEIKVDKPEKPEINNVAEADEKELSKKELIDEINEEYKISKGTEYTDSMTELNEESSQDDFENVKIHRPSNDMPIYEKEIYEKFGNTEPANDSQLQKLLVRAAEEDAAFEEEIEEIEEVEQVVETVDAVEEDNALYVNDTGIVDTDPFKHTDFLEPALNKTVSINDYQDSNNSPLAETSCTKEALETEKKEDIEVEIPYEPIPYIFPDLDLLSKPEKKSDFMTDEQLKETAKKLQDCLKSFKVDVTMTDIICGPTVTRYELMPALGTRVKKITELENDIKLNLAAKDLRIEAPIPGKSAVGIEVPNKKNVVIKIREMLETKEFFNHKSNLAFAVGKDIGGNNIVADIEKMPHLLIAGSTGSGKSVCINTIVMSLIYKADPNDVKLIMIDPKVVELSVYNGIPHLCIPVVTDPKKAAAALHWAEIEMDNRFSKFAELGTRNIAGYNKEVEDMDDPAYRKMPHIVVIVDELADLMMVASHDVENSICRLAQKARACGIHLIIATQRPSVDVITGLIKANVPSRIAFAVSSQVDSRTILDSQGAEKLLGKGDMLFFPQGMAKPIRVQGAFVSDNEVARVTDFIKAQYDAPTYDASINDKISQVQLSSNNKSVSVSDDEEDDGRDEYFEEAGRFVIEKQKASIGALQRVFKIGFNRGARIMDQLAEAGVVSEEEGAKKPRNILMTLQEFEDYLNS